MDNDLIIKIDALINSNQQASTQLTLKHTLENNINAFTRFGASFQNEYRQYIPQNIDITIDSSSTINLINRTTGKSIYPDDPYTFCQQQVERYQLSPSRTCVLPTEIKEGAKGVIALKQNIYLNQLFNYLATLIDEHPQSPNFDKVPTGLFIINGIGLGYHIPMLIKAYDIDHLVLIEHDRDMFYASLCVLDWSAILGHFSNSIRSIQFNIDMANDTALASIGSLINTMGLHLTANYYTYNHIESQKSLQTGIDLMANVDKLIVSAGFIEDELVSLDHSLHNIVNYPVLNRFNQIQQQCPVFIIANGPSLDDSITFIKKHQHKVITISCGTALSALEKYEIQPDIHIELERPKKIAEFLKNGCSTDFLKKILCIAMQNVTPELLSLFKQSYICLKWEDAGSYALSDLYPSIKPLLEFTNPTVTNTALNIAIALGFSKIYLLGTDLAYIDDNQHHSQKSSYYQSQEMQSYKIAAATIDVPGNFKDQVKTTSVFRDAAHYIGHLLRLYPQITVYNLSDGMQIQYAHPLSHHDATEQLKTMPTIDKALIIHKFLEHHFTDQFTGQVISNQMIDSRIVEPIKLCLQSIPQTPPVNSIQQVYDVISRIMHTLHQQKNRRMVGYLSTNGSIGYFTKLVYLCCIFSKDNQTPQKDFSNTYMIFLEFLSEMQHELQTLTETLKIISSSH